MGPYDACTQYPVGASKKYAIRSGKESGCRSSLGLLSFVKVSGCWGLLGRSTLFPGALLAPSSVSISKSTSLRTGCSPRRIHTILSVDPGVVLYSCRGIRGIALHYWMRGFRSHCRFGLSCGSSRGAENGTFECVGCRCIFSLKLASS